MIGFLVFAYLVGVWTWFETGGPGNYATRAMLGRDYRKLAGKRLACWCRDGQPCHADALAEAVEILCREAADG